MKSPLPIQSPWYLILGLALAGAAAAQPPKPDMNAAELQLALDKLQVAGSVLYVAAHPDDENTAALACFSKGRKLRTAYLAITRGGGGQNLIGPELDDSLAAIRTQELLAARRIDGAEQFFTRAVDFGYSKTAEETLAIWGKEAVLSDVVWVIRKFRPDVIVTRFSPTADGGHGHHKASALLAVEAFSAAADPARFPEQLKYVQPWQARRIVWNSWRPREERDKLAPGSYLSVDLGEYNALLGKAYTELAAEGRSMHRSQGFGAVASRGSRLDYFEVLAGDPAKSDLFEGIDQTWRRIPGSEKAADLLALARREYVPEHPAAVLPLLLRARSELEKLPADPWIAVKQAELTEAIRSAAGIWAEAVADAPTVAPGGKVAVTATLVARGGFPVTLAAVAVQSPMETRAKNVTLADNQPVKEEFSVTLPADAPCSQPYWLRGPHAGGLHCAAPPELAGLAEDPPALSVAFRLSADGVPFELTVPVQYRLRDPVLGERYRPLVVVPPVMVNLAEGVEVFGDTNPREITLNVVAGLPGATGQVRLAVPDGWRVVPAAIPFALAKPFDEIQVTAKIFPPAAPQTGELGVSVETGGNTFPARGVVRIDYPHIPPQTLFPPAAARLVRLELRRDGRRIGYVVGAGDDIPQCLRPLGYTVDLLPDEALESADLSGYDAIVVGIRAFNTRPRLAQLNARLLDYAARGGTLVVLYDVSQGLVTEAIGPYPFKISRDRVTDERAEMRPLAPDHPVLNWPNKITAADFDGWVQERGLYYAESWDPRYTAIFSANDPGEKPLDGGLLVAPCGQGWFAYTGLAFFRQLPDGVPGAYRLFANLLALGKRPATGDR